MFKNSSDDNGRTKLALLLIDVINDLDFEGNEGLLECIPALIDSLKMLKKGAQQAGIPVIYVNDNFKKWRYSFEQTYKHCTRAESPGALLARNLKPDEDDFFILKPMHSGFFCTPLELLLRELQAETLVLTGVAGNICVLFTANDAYMRGYNLVVPCDCIASNSQADNQCALDQMRQLHRADTRPAADIVRNLFNSLWNGSRREDLELPPSREVLL